jgi:hypothetical protein
MSKRARRENFRKRRGLTNLIGRDHDMKEKVIRRKCEKENMMERVWKRATGRT